jgi:aconitate hydratase
MGVLPLMFVDGMNWPLLGLTGEETVSILGLSADMRPRQRLSAEITFPDGRKIEVPLVSRIDTADELDYFRSGGILHYVLRALAAR